MPANTLNDMILGFAVILGLLLIYVITLMIRIHRAKQHDHHDTHP